MSLPRAEECGLKLIAITDAVIHIRGRSRIGSVD